MTIGTSIFLLVVGAILAFAVEVDIPGVSAAVAGYILMAAGGIGLVVGLALLARRSRPRSTSSTQVTEQVDTPDGQATVHRRESQVD